MQQHVRKIPTGIGVPIHKLYLAVFIIAMSQEVGIAMLGFLRCELVKGLTTAVT